MAETLGVDDCAEFLHVHRNTVLELAGSGELPGAQVGRSWVFLKEDVVAYLRKRINEQTANRRALAEAERLLDSGEKSPDVLANVTSIRHGRGNRRKTPPALPDLPSPEFRREIAAS